MSEKNGWLTQGNGEYWLTEADKRVPAECPICGAPVKLRFFGEPVFTCTRDKLTKGEREHYLGTLKFTPPSETDK